MSLQDRLGELVSAVGTDVKALDDRLGTLEGFAKVKVLEVGETPDPSLPAGTVLLRKKA